MEKKNQIYITLRLSLFFILSIIGLGVVNSCTQSKGQADVAAEMGEWTPRIGGVGGVFFNAEKGPLVIEIEKQDLNLSKSPTALRVILTGPDRAVIDDQWIPHAGLTSGAGIGPGQSLQLETYLDRPGVYAVMITAANDRYGENIIWRFRTNCEKYMIETSRGHKDEEHKEPIVLKDPETETDLCFLPQNGAFDILITGMDESVKFVELKDSKDQQIAILKVENDTVFQTIKAGGRESIPWKLHFPKAQAKVEIEGVTEWKDDGTTWFFENSNGALWTPVSDSWFPIQSNRWLIAPHNRLIYGQSGEQKTTIFKIHNNGKEPENVSLSLEFPQEKWNVELSSQVVKLAPNEKKEVQLTWVSSDEDKTVHLRATGKDYTTYSTLYAKAGVSPAASNIEIPLVLKPYFHEHEQFGYLPDYPLDNQMYFNTDNTPFVRTADGISSLQNGKWKTVLTGSMLTSIIAFDADGDVYTLAKENGEAVLLYSSDGGQNFSSYRIPGNSEGSGFDIEQFSGHNVPPGPPAITRYTRKGADAEHFWRRYGDMELLIPKKTANGIEWEDPILISKECLGVSSHSGIPSSIVTRGSKIFLSWGEVSDPDVSREEIPGVPVYVTSYDKSTKKLETPVLVGFGAPPNDVHNIPGITIDSDGFLHVLTGTHGRPFKYAKSLVPESVHQGWTKAEPVMEADDSRSTQTYIGLVTGPDNTLHLVFRLWRYNTEYFPNNYFASLAYMSKKPGESWTKPQVLVVAPFSHYSLYRHRLTIDREGRLFLSYFYWSTYWFYRNDRNSNERSLLMSPDGGRSWKMAQDSDLEK